MKRYQSRNISRSRNRVEALDPCNKYSVNAGINPFARLLAQLSLAKQIAGRSKEQAEKEVAHELKMKADQKSAKARQQRKRNKV